MKDIFDLTNKIALVTGASRGIGKSIACLLAGKGAHVIVSSRKIEGCQAVKEEICDQGYSAEAKTCHIGEMPQIESLIDYIKLEHQKLDILVNNAASNPYFGPILDTDLKAYTKTVDVNLRGYFFVSTGAGKLMRDNGGGNIINIASVNGIVPGQWQGVYSITKAGIINMTKAFAKECAADNIRVNAILPGLTQTKLAGAIVDNPAILHTIPMQRCAQPDEIASAALYLASDASSYVTGLCMNVDGGWLA